MSRTRAIGYLRVSTDEQATEGVSLDAQRAKIAAYCSLYEIDLVGVEVDAGASAKSLDRPGLQRALGALRRGDATAIVVVKLDRLTRSVRDLGELLEVFSDERLALLSVAEQVDTRSAAGRLVLRLLTSVAEWEREAIGERTSAAMRHLAAQGRYTGGAARYGYTVGDGGALVEDAGEQAVIARARALRAAGMSIRAIGCALDEGGARNRAGRHFGVNAIASMLAS